MARCDSIARSAAASVSPTMRTHRDDFVLPVRFDDTDLDGLQPTLTYLSANAMRPFQLAEKILKKLSLPSVVQEQELQIWKIISPKYASEAFSSMPASRFGGRLNYQGTNAVYCASSRCVAILETMVHLEPTGTRNLIAVGAKLNLSLPATVLSQADMPENWAQLPPSESMKEFGSRWLKSNISVALKIPSIVLPAEQIILLNPMHPDFQTLTIFTEEPVDTSGLHLVHS
ncbi:RES family NAD+ phosphorylase [Pseudomonas fluorescens]|nr:RES domain-containing protein [Pseudomonas fluorescens]